MKGLALWPLLLATCVLGARGQRRVSLREEFQDGGETLGGAGGDGGRR